MLWRFSQAMRGGVVEITGVGDGGGVGGSEVLRKGFETASENRLTGKLRMCNVPLMP